jgi:hypothetical protein
VTAGQSCDCIKCGPGGCAVFVPTVYDKNLCQCGHASLYHHLKGVKGNPIANLIDGNNGGGDGDESDERIAEGFQKFKGGEQNPEVSAKCRYVHLYPIYLNLNIIWVSLQSYTFFIIHHH